MMHKFFVEQSKMNSKLEEEMQHMRQTMDQLQVHNRILETQLAQQASSSGSKSYGKLPSQPQNPHEQCKVVTLRSGKKVGQESENKREEKESTKEENSVESKKNEKEEESKSEQDEGEKPYIPPEPYKPTLPYPQRFIKHKLDKQFGKFLEVLKKLYINVPFTEALSQMLSYAKFLKEILTNKRRLEDYDTINLGEQCSAIIQKKLPPKLKDPGVFSIPYHIGDNYVANALCDLRASVSLMLLSIYEELNMGELKPTNMYLSLADRSIKYPEGILENVPIKFGKFYIPVDFVILDMEEDTKVPILLGRPFFSNSWCIN